MHTFDYVLLGLMALILSVYAMVAHRLVAPHGDRGAVCCVYRGPCVRGASR